MRLAFSSKRIDQARADVADQLEHLDEDKVDTKFVESDGFLDWLREAFDQIRRAEDKAKLDALRNTFVNGLLVGQSAGARQRHRVASHR